METERAPRWGTESPLRGRTSDRGFQPPTALQGSSARRSLRMRTYAIEAFTGPTSVRTNTSASSIAPRWRRVLMGAPKMSISGEALDRSDGCTSGAWLGASACGRVAGLGTQTRSRQSVRCNGFCLFPRGNGRPNFGVSSRGAEDSPLESDASIRENPLNPRCPPGIRGRDDDSKVPYPAVYFPSNKVRHPCQDDGSKVL